MKARRKAQNAGHRTSERTKSSRCYKSRPLAYHAHPWKRYGWRLHRALLETGSHGGARHQRAGYAQFAVPVFVHGETTAKLD